MGGGTRTVLSQHVLFAPFAFDGADVRRGKGAKAKSPRVAWLGRFRFESVKRAVQAQPAFVDEKRHLQYWVTAQDWYRIIVVRRWGGSRGLDKREPTEGEEGTESRDWSG